MHYIIEIAAILGALAWAPWIYDTFFKKPVIKGKIISRVSNLGKFNNRDGLIYFLKLSIISLYKNFNIRDIVIKVKYQNSKEVYDAEMFWARYSSWVFENNEKKSRKELKIPNDEFLGFLKMLPKDTPLNTYVTFRVDKAEIDNFDYILFRFISHNNYVSELKIYENDINEDLILFDEKIWTDK